MAEPPGADPQRIISKLIWEFTHPLLKSFDLSGLASEEPDEIARFEHYTSEVISYRGW